MAKVVEEEGGKIHLNTGVEKVLVTNRKATGVQLENGESVTADAVIINADFAHAMNRLFEPGVLKTYHKEALFKKKFSCSTFMLYLGLDRLYDEPHHQIIIAEDYKANIDDIVNHRAPSDDLSVYVRNASITDRTLAPEGHSAVYVLVPVSNNRSSTVWDEKTVAEYRHKVLDRIKSRTSMKDIESHIIEEKVITPKGWEEDEHVYLGATFNLGHQLSQMLYLRPKNRFEEVINCYLVGGGTHPGSGLPTIYESGRITSNLICKDFTL
jgi:phytoene desaturase